LILFSNCLVNKSDCFEKDCSISLLILPIFSEIDSLTILLIYSLGLVPNSDSIGSDFKLSNFEDIKPNSERKLFQLAFGVLIACIIPITIKLYSSQIRAKEWLELDEKPKEISSEIQTEIFDNINLLAERNNQLDTNLNDLRSEFGLISSKLDNLKSEPIESEFGTNPKEYINNIVKESISENIGNINKEIEQSFSKQSDLFTRQFENKIKFMMDSKK
jgi:hypothetical protein